MDWIRKMLLHHRELLCGENKGLIYLSFDTHFLKTSLHTSSIFVERVRCFFNHVAEHSMIFMQNYFCIERFFFHVSCSSSIFVPEILQVLVHFCCLKVVTRAMRLIGYRLRQTKKCYQWVLGVKVLWTTWLGRRKNMMLIMTRRF